MSALLASCVLCSGRDKRAPVSRDLYKEQGSHLTKIEAGATFPRGAAAAAGGSVPGSDVSVVAQASSVESSQIREAPASSSCQSSKCVS